MKSVKASQVGVRRVEGGYGFVVFDENGVQCFRFETSIPSGLTLSGVIVEQMLDVYERCDDKKCDSTRAALSGVVAVIQALSIAAKLATGDGGVAAVDVVVNSKAPSSMVN